MILLSGALSALTYGVGVMAVDWPIGDVFGSAGSAPYGANEPLQVYYRPLLAVLAGVLAFLHPRSSVITAPVFAGTQAVACVAIELFRSPSPLWIAYGPLVAFAVLPWVGIGAVIGVVLRLAARTIAGSAKR
jgi:hypothetical protein